MSEARYGMGSRARGLAVVAVVATTLVGGQQLCASWQSPANSHRGLCENPVEIVTSHGARLACTTDPAIATCGAVHAGDRITVPSCQISTMAAATRLLTGLPLDLNRATQSDLRLLTGIGPKKAAAIVADRESRGPFRSLVELTRVPGLGKKTVERLSAHLTVLP